MATSFNHVLAQVQRWTAAQAAEASDAELLQRYVHQGDESAFTALVVRHGAMVLRLCRRILCNAHEAEDAFQATFFVLARKAASLKQPDALSSWLHGVARRVALKARTKAAAHSGDTALTEELTASCPDPLAQLTARELLEILDEEVERLPAVQRSVVILCCLEGRTREEAAHILGSTSISLKGHLQRGRQRLQARLRKRGIALSAALALAAVSHGEATSALLLRSTVAAVLHGNIGSAAAVLAHGILKTMFLTKLATAMTGLLMVALAASATVAVVYRGSMVESSADKPAIAAAPKEPVAGKPPIRTDALGESLPAGAMARLGSQRFRHCDDIVRIDFSADGKRLISQAGDGVRFWDAATGKELRRIAPKVGQTWIVENLSPDGKWLVGKSANSDRFVTEALELWDAQSGQKIADVGEGFCANACFSANGKLLAFSSKLKNICIYDLKSRRMLRSWQGHPIRVWPIAFSADSLQLIATDRPGIIRLWDVATGRQLQQFEPEGGGLKGMGNHEIEPALSPDGKLLALIEKNERHTPAAGKVEWKARISLRDTATGKQVRLLTCAAKEFVPGFAFPFISLLFRRDSKRLLTSGPDEFLREWDATTGEELRRIALPLEFPSTLRALSRDEKQLAAVMLDGRAIRLIDLDNGKVRAEPASHQAPVDLAILAPDGRTAITGCLPISALIWDAAKGTLRRRFDNQNLPFGALKLAADGRTLFSTSADKTLRVWDMETGKLRRAMNVLQGYGAEGEALVVSRDGKIVAFVDRQLATRSIRVLDGETGQERQRFRASDSIYGLSLSVDSRSLVGWSLEGKVRVWDLAAGVKRHEYALPQVSDRAHYRAAVSPDGRLFAFCTQQIWTAKDAKSDNWLIVKDLTSGQDVLSIRNPSSDRGVLTFSPDGRTLVYSGTFDATIRILEVASGKERHRLAGFQGRATALSFSASGGCLISGCADTTALIWDLGLRLAPRPATAEELMKLWADLADADAARAYQAIRKLASSPSSAIPFIRKNLSAAATVDAKRLARLIADLDSDDFAARQKSTEEMEKLDERAAPLFRKALEGKPSLEVHLRLENLLDKAQRAWWDASGERLRSLRTIEVLELAGTEEAREVLRTIAAGADGARVTEEAKAALERLAQQASK